jgi:TonB family protein
MRQVCFDSVGEGRDSAKWRFRSERTRLRFLVLGLVIPLLASLTSRTVSAGERPPLGSHIPPLQHPFAIPDPLWRSLFAATTPDGKQLSASQIAPLVVRQYWPGGTVTSASWHLKIGIFLLNVRNDGTVSSVEILQSTGHRVLDGNCVKAFAKWRFRPNSVKEVRLPAYYTRTH